MRNLKPVLVLFVCFLMAAPSSAQKKNKPLYKDSNLAVEVRVKDLLERMTLDEKISQMNMLSLKHLKFDKKGRVTKKSLDSLFKAGSIGTLESPFIGVDQIAALSEAADTYLRKNTTRNSRYSNSRMFAWSVGFWSHYFSANGRTRKYLES